MVFDLLGRYKNIKTGTDLYNKEKYAESKVYFEKAYQNNSNDYIVNFWLLRVAIITNDNDNAKEYLKKCVNINPEIKRELADPWAGLLDSVSTKTVNFSALNERTNNLLAYYQTTREFSIMNISVIFILYLLVRELYFLIVSISNLQNKYWESYLYIITLVLFFFAPVTIYYYFKPKLPPDFCQEIVRAGKQFHQLFKRESFVLICLIFCALTVIPIVLHQINPETSRESAKMNIAEYGNLPMLNYFALLTVIPICEELIFRGILFRYLNKYNLLLAYFMTSVLFYYFHGSMKSEWNFITSLLFCWVFDYFGTITAPIILHFINNFLFIISLLLDIYIILLN